MRADWQESWHRWIATDDRAACARILVSTVLSLAPAIVASLIASKRVSALAVVVVIPLCYRASAIFQEALFELRTGAAQAWIAMPLQLLFFAWALALLALDRRDQVGSSLLAALLLALTAIAPLFRPARSTRRQRRIPYAISYACVAILILGLQLSSVLVRVP